ncbi:MAG: hypothetical protein RL385_1991, partial [Pseudomonadota bacterium]
MEKPRSIRLGYAHAEQRKIQPRAPFEIMARYST